MTLLRDKETSIEEFRKASFHLSSFLAHCAMDRLPKQSVDIKTPLGNTRGKVYQQPTMLVPILRAGLAMLPPFLDLFPSARVGFIGFKRNEKTAIADMYYENIPEISRDETVIILDPMLATGGSAHKAVECLIKKGARPAQIQMVSMIGSTEGIAFFKKQFEDIELILAEEDPELTDEKFIFPGLGDFGDRFFGTVDG